MSQGGGRYTEEEAKTWSTWRGKPRGGESYEDMSNRIVPTFQRVVLPLLCRGENVLMVIHNGVSKPLQRYLKNLAYEATTSLDMKNCEVIIYDFDLNGEVIGQESRCP